MKNKFLVLGISMILLVGCGKDDDTTGTYIGTWIATNINITSCEDFTNDDSMAVQCTDNNCYKIVFSDDGTYRFQTGLSTESGTWTASGVSITFCIEEDGEDVCRTGIGSINSVGLTLSFSAEANGCLTSYVMEKSITDDPEEDPN